MSLRLRQDYAPRPYRAAIATDELATTAFEAMWPSVRRAAEPVEDELRRCWGPAPLDTLRSRLASPALAESWVAVVPCVEVLVEEQMDPTLRDRRVGSGLARWVGPSLAATFPRAFADPGMQLAFGRLIEARMCGAFAGSALAWPGVALPAVSATPEEVLARLTINGPRLGRRLDDAQKRVRAGCDSDMAPHGEAIRRLLGWRHGRRSPKLAACDEHWVEVGTTLYILATAESPGAEPAAVRNHPRWPNAPVPHEPLGAELELPVHEHLTAVAHA